jgi:hypothetical protein
MSYDFNDHADVAMKRPTMESKCPVCGSILVDEDPCYKCYGNECWFRCNKEHLPRISAAMDLARATAKYGNEAGFDELRIDNGGDDEIVDLVNDAAFRVLEVFGGE